MPADAPLPPVPLLVWSGTGSSFLDTGSLPPCTQPTFLLLRGLVSRFSSLWGFCGINWLLFKSVFQFRKEFLKLIFNFVVTEFELRILDLIFF